MENLICRGILFSQKDPIGLADLGLAPEARAFDLPVVDTLPMDYKAAKQQALRRFNEAFIGQLLKTHRGNVTQAAKACGLERQALQQVLRRYGIGADAFRGEP
jgi:DNA-binding NtrC family response regulator